MVSDSFYDKVTSAVVKPQTTVMRCHCEIIAWLNTSDKFSNCKSLEDHTVGKASFQFSLQ